MAKSRVLIVGATGETGGSILEGLLESGETVCSPVRNDYPVLADKFDSMLKSLFAQHPLRSHRFPSLRKEVLQFMLAI
jgi:hypothetical protein